MTTAESIWLRESLQFNLIIAEDARFDTLVRYGAASRAMAQAELLHHCHKYDHEDFKTLMDTLRRERDAMQQIQARSTCRPT